MTLASFCLAAALAHAPPAATVGKPWGDATIEEAHVRYASICADVAAVVQERKLGRDAVALLIALGVGESGLARDADLGLAGNCYQGKTGKLGRCDADRHGRARSVSVWQVRCDVSRDEAGLITCERLFADRRLAARQALRRALASMKACTKGPAEDRLSALATGVCGIGDYPGRKSVRARWALFQKIRGGK